MKDDAARQPADPEEDAPTGWKRLVPGAGRFFRLSTEHPDYPRSWIAKHRQKERSRLDQSGEADIAVEEIRLVWEAAEPQMRAATTFDEWFEVYQTLGDALERDARLIPLGDRFVRRAYLVERVLPADLAPLAGEPDTSPVEIIVNDDTFPIPVELGPGEIIIRLADVPPTHLTEFRRLIAEAQQQILGYEDQRGRPTDVDKAKQIANLRKSGGGHARDIVQTIDGRHVRGDTARKRVTRAVTRVEELNASREAKAAEARTERLNAKKTWAQIQQVKGGEGQ